MTFEASINIPGGGVTARLHPSSNRAEIEAHGAATPAEITTALPKLLQHLANRSRLPIRRDGMTFYPRPMPRHDAEPWGEPGTLSEVIRQMSATCCTGTYCIPLSGPIIKIAFETLSE